MSESSSPTLWSTVAALPDYLLLAQTRQLARHEQALQILVLDHLREIEARRLHLTRGCGSLFDYVVHELGYTAAAAWRRIKAMRLCSQTKGARELLQDGSLNLSNAAQLQNLFERSDRSRGRPPGSDGTGGDLGGAARNDGSPGEPAPPEPMRAGESDPAPVPGPVLDAAAREDLVKQAAGKSTREVQQMLAEVDPELAQPNDRMRALGGGRWELKAAVDAECRHGLEKLLMLLSHRDPHLTLGGLVARLVRDGLDRYDPARPRRARHTGGRGSGMGEQSASTPARRDTGAAERNVARAEGGCVERQSEVDRGDASFGAAVRDGSPSPSAAKRPGEAEHGSTKSAAVGSSDGYTTSPAKCHSGTAHGGALPVTAPSGGGCPTPPAKRQSEAELGGVSHGVARNGGGPAIAAAQRDTETERGGAKAGASVPGCHREPETEHACGQPNEMGGSGRAASLAKRRGQTDGDDRDAGVGGILDRATCASGPRFDADRCSASRAPVRGGRRFPTSAAQRPAAAAGPGAVGPAERSPAPERHLAALHCFGALPGSRSRYIPVAVKREVWRRDQGCCSYVDRHSGRRCGSRYRLEIDHIVPFALGGGAEPGDLRLLCGAHHRLRHAQRHAQAESVPTAARRAPVFAVDRQGRGRAVGSHAAIDGPGSDRTVVEA